MKVLVNAFNKERTVVVAFFREISFDSSAERTTVHVHYSVLEQFPGSFITESGVSRAPVARCLVAHN